MNKEKLRKIIREWLYKEEEEGEYVYYLNEEELDLVTLDGKFEDLIERIYPIVP